MRGVLELGLNATRCASLLNTVPSLGKTGGPRHPRNAETWTNGIFWMISEHIYEIYMACKCLLMWWMIAKWTT